MIIQQLNTYKGNTGTLVPYDFCLCRRGERYLSNKRNNGWAIGTTPQAHFNFKLELIK